MAERSTDYCFFIEEVTPEIVEKYLEGKKNHEYVPNESLEANLSDGCENPCIIKNIARSFYLDRDLHQMRCVHDYGWILGEELKRPVKIYEVVKAWIENGFANVFAQIYEQNLKSGDQKSHWETYLEAERMLREGANKVK